LAKDTIYMITPQYLKAGDTIGIVAPARKIVLGEIQAAINTFQAWGLEVVLGHNLLKSDHQFSGTDEQRAEDLQIMLDRPDIKAVIAARGGYGTLRIIDALDFSTFKQHPKWIIGYSDITVLHAHINSLGVESLHATMPLNFFKSGPQDPAVEALHNALFGKSIQYKYTASSHNQHLLRAGNVSGGLVGGNLSILYALSSSVSDIHTDGKILFIEDLDEYLYHIDRMMLQLDRSGKLKNLKGLIVGGMTQMKDNAIPFGKSVEEIIFDAVRKYDVPVCFDFPAGHLADNKALILGREVALSVGESVVLKF
jgi:muramoyltetrapeptide carboxypeptidase